MKLRFLLIAVFYCIQLQLLGQLSVEAIDHTSQIEYEKTDYCTQYDGEVANVFKVEGLTKGYTYALHFQDPAGTDNFNQVQFIPQDYWNWEIIDGSGYVQRWRWDGDNDGEDFFSVHVTITGYSNVEVGL